MGQYFQFSTFIFIVFVAYFIRMIQYSYLRDETRLGLAYLSLFLPYRSFSLFLWENFVHFDTEIEYPPMPVPEIQAKDFSYEVMKIATNNFRTPAVVRGLFKDSKAVKLWGTEDYFIKKFGHFTIPIVRNAVVGTLQDHRELVNFGEAFKEMYHKDYSTEYLFFPVKSRFTFNGSNEGSAQELQDHVDQLCREDLEFDRFFWKNFGNKKIHWTYMASQLVIGKSINSIGSNISTGSDWHCAGGNNWFIQAVGQKTWEFIEPKYSHYLYPLKGGFFNMWTANKNIHTLIKHVPHYKVTLNAGDMVYNPDWMWHKITNHGGLSVGVPVREINITLTIQNNKMFTAITLTNKLLTLFGLQLGGYPPPSAKTEADN